MQFNALLRSFLNARLLLTSRQTAPAASAHTAGLHVTALRHDDGGVTKSAAPEKPKRPVNTYIRFVQSIRSSLASANPQASPAEIAKLAAGKWQTLDQSAKTKLEEEYKREQAVWLQKNAKYLSQLTDSQKQEIKQERQQKQEERAKREQKRLMKDLGRPKRPLNGYLCFCSDNKPKPGLSREENKLQMKSLGLQWKRLSDADRQRYVRQAEEDVKRYHAEMKAWEDKMLASDHVGAVRKKNVLLPPSPSSTGVRGGAASTLKVARPKKSPIATRP